jgi:hypothetical protein
MERDWLALGSVVGATIAAVGAAVLVHYEGLVIAQRGIAREHASRRRKVLHAVSILIILHVVEIWIFGLVAWLLSLWAATGVVEGASDMLDYLYFSAVCYTTLGFGDLVPAGPIRFLAATEALMGLVLIAWSASFTFLEMERFWRGAE